MFVKSDDYSNAKLERQEHGAIIVDGQQVASTLQCCHCGTHFVSVQGSGMRRGFCMKCMAVTCGADECMNCVPIEKWLQMQERGVR